MPLEKEVEREENKIYELGGVAQCHPNTAIQLKNMCTKQTTGRPHKRVRLLLFHCTSTKPQHSQQSTLTAVGSSERWTGGRLNTRGCVGSATPPSRSKLNCKLRRVKLRLLFRSKVCGSKLSTGGMIDNHITNTQHTLTLHIIITLYIIKHTCLSIRYLCALTASRSKKSFSCRPGSALLCFAIAYSPGQGGKLIRGGGK